MGENLSRKEFLRAGTKYAAGFAVGATVLGGLDLNKLHAGTTLPDWPWPYTQIDPEVARITGHDAYYTAGCCYGGFHGVIQTLRDAVGEPFASFPDDMMRYGSGGAAGWGATCGAINGAAAAITLVTAASDVGKLVGELFGWYTLTNLPTDTSNLIASQHGFGVDNYSDPLPQSASHSPLCHASVTMWCKEASLKESTTERKERCARLTGDVAAYAVQLLNDNLAGQFTPLYTTPQDVTDCLTCHGKTGAIDNVASKMECESCHGDPHVSGIRQVETLALNYELTQNYPNPFNPSTMLKFSLPKGEHVFLQVFDGHGRLVTNLVNGDYMTPGTYEVRWDGNSDFGVAPASGIFYARFTAGSYTRTRKMVLTK